METLKPKTVEKSIKDLIALMDDAIADVAQAPVEGYYVVVMEKDYLPFRVTKDHHLRLFGGPIKTWRTKLNAEGIANILSMKTHHVIKAVPGHTFKERRLEALRDLKAKLDLSGRE